MSSTQATASWRRGRKGQGVAEATCVPRASLPRRDLVHLQTPVLHTLRHPAKPASYVLGAGKPGAESVAGASHTQPQGKQSPVAQPGRLTGMGMGDSDSGSSGRAPRTPAPRMAAPAQGLASAGGVGEGRGPMIGRSWKLAQRGLLLPHLCTAPEGGSQDLCEFIGPTGAPGPPLDVRGSQARGVRGRHWGYQGHGGGRAGGGECHPGQRGGRCRRRGTRPS